VRAKPGLSSEKKEEELRFQEKKYAWLKQGKKLVYYQDQHGNIIEHQNRQRHPQERSQR
jgi:hypothetical protein